MISEPYFSFSELAEEIEVGEKNEAAACEVCLACAVCAACLGCAVCLACAVLGPVTAIVTLAAAGEVTSVALTASTTAAVAIGVNSK